MAQPQGDLADILRGFQVMDGLGVPQHVQKDLLLDNGLYHLCSCPGIHSQAKCSQCRCCSEGLLYADQYFPFADVVGGGNDAFILHAFNDAGGLVVTNLHLSLEIGNRDLLITHDYANRILVFLVS